MSVELRLAEALASVIASIELSDDDEIDPDVATKITEPVADILSRLTIDERVRVTELMRLCAASETNDLRREVIEEFPEAYGLLDEE